ncbi:hypothetical protein OCU04_000740 [Sclerotinia nivalis]|uniref:Uncharacterized protein n=1 Tax=Sclerotinia nivalis TaxID=352851 RepID=A0A9X0AXD1_9HELO|nr:hypothetical protein OCU04_000740 [Sclerotinia nivalis]
MAASTRKTHIPFMTSTVILLLLSIATINFHGSILAFISWGTLSVTEDLHFDYKTFKIYVLPEHLDVSSSKLALASGVISLVISAACVAFEMSSWPNSKRTYPHPPVSILRSGLIFNALFSFVAMVYLQITYFHSSTYEPNYRGHYHEGTFDFESWTCQVIQYSNEFPHRHCGNARAGRVMEALLCFIAIVATVVGLPVLRGERSTINQAKDDMGRQAEYYVGAGEKNDDAIGGL